MAIRDVFAKQREDLNFLDMAKHLLDLGYKSAAVVVAGSKWRSGALEGRGVRRARSELRHGLA